MKTLLPNFNVQFIAAMALVSIFVRLALAKSAAHITLEYLNAPNFQTSHSITQYQPMLAFENSVVSHQVRLLDTTPKKTHATLHIIFLKQTVFHIFIRTALIHIFRTGSIGSTWTKMFDRQAES